MVVADPASHFFVPHSLTCLPPMRAATLRVSTTYTIPAAQAACFYFPAPMYISGGSADQLVACASFIGAVGADLSLTTATILNYPQTLSSLVPYAMPQLATSMVVAGPKVLNIEVLRSSTLDELPLFSYVTPGTSSGVAQYDLQSMAALTRDITGSGDAIHGSVHARQVRFQSLFGTPGNGSSFANDFPQIGRRKASHFTAHMPAPTTYSGENPLGSIPVLTTNATITTLTGGNGDGGYLSTIRDITTPALTVTNSSAANSIKLVVDLAFQVCIPITEQAAISGESSFAAVCPFAHPDIAHVYAGYTSGASTIGFSDAKKLAINDAGTHPLSTNGAPGLTGALAKYKAIRSNQLAITAPPNPRTLEHHEGSEGDKPWYAKVWGGLKSAVSWTVDHAEDLAAAAQAGAKVVEAFA